MSWNIKIIGSSAAVAAKIAADASLPDELKQLVSRIAATPSDSMRLPYSGFNGLAIETSGHVDSAGGNVYDFKVQPVVLELDPPAAAPAQD